MVVKAVYVPVLKLWIHTLSNGSGLGRIVLCKKKHGAPFQPNLVTLSQLQMSQDVMMLLLQPSLTFGAPSM